jgi:signal transduction histidine kinase
VLAEWRRSALGAGVAMGALTLLLVGVLVQQLRARRRREYRRTQRAQADKLEAMGQLTGGISHDFANLLSIISMNLDLILRKPGDAQATQRAAMAARRAVERGSDLIRRLLAFARRQPLELKAADLNSLLAEAHPLVAQAAGARIELVLQLAPDLPPVMIDEAQFEMALLNLVVNARDALSGHGRIVLRTHAAPGGDPCLTVEDNGPGMGEATRGRALEPFFTTKGPAGTGLGLPQVYGFLQQIGGGLEIDSAPGKGTRVEMRFPRAPALTEVKAGG